MADLQLFVHSVGFKPCLAWNNNEEVVLAALLVVSSSCLMFGRPPRLMKPSCRLSSVKSQCSTSYSLATSSYCSLDCTLRLIAGPCWSVNVVAALAVLLQYSCSTLAVLSQFSCSTLAVLSQYSCGTLAVLVVSRLLA